MVRSTTATDDAVEYANDQIDRAIESHDVDVETYEPTTIGSGDDAYVSATIVFDPRTTAREVARVRRSLPMSFEKEIDFRGGDTLALRLRLSVED